MRAIAIASPGGPEVLEERDVALPEPGAGQLRVRVHAVGVNRADLLQRQGRYPAPPGVSADVPGLEFAGTVDALGPGVEGWRVGDRVMGLVGGGAYAEAVVVDAREVVAIPAGLSFEEAAAVPEAFITAHDALFTLLDLRAGESVLIHAVGSGVGTAAVQLARAAGARVLGTSRSAWKLERATSLGLDLGIDAGAEAFADAVRRHTDGRGVDVVLDLVGGGYLRGNLESLAVKGRMAVVGLVAGRRAELDLGLLLARRLTVIGTVMRGRSPDEKAAAVAAFRDAVVPLLEEGRVRPVVDVVLAFHEVREAHRRVEADRNFGKVVLTWGA